MFYNKKTLISCFLLFWVVFILTVPQIANAGLGAIFINVLTTLPVVATSVMSGITASFLSWVASPNAIQTAYTPHPAGWGYNNEMVDNGWRICRDLANMLIVLGFVVIAIATILRFQEYEAKKLLPKLIIAAILVNFSPVICGLVIDASNITMNFFMEKTSIATFSTILSKTEEQFGSLWEGSWTNETILSALLKGTAYILGNIVGLFVYGLLFFLLFARYIMLWILVIFSPIAFVCYVFPFTKKFASQWWDNFLKWCIMGIPVAFTLYLATMSTTIKSTAPAGISDQLIKFSFPAMIMLVGFFYSLKFSGAGAAIALGAAVAVGGAALGVVGKAGSLAKFGGKALNAMGGNAARVGGAALGALGTGLEATAGLYRGGAKMLGLKPPEAKEELWGAEARAQRRKEEHDRLNQMSSEQLAKLRFGISPTEQARRAERTAILGGRGDLDMLGDKKDAEVARAISNGVNRDVFTKTEPSYAKGSEREVNKLIAAEGDKLRKMGMSTARIRSLLKDYKPGAQRIADDEAYTKAVQKLAGPKLLDFAPESLHIDTAKRLGPRQIKLIDQKGSPALVNKVKSHIDEIIKMALAEYDKHTPAGDIEGKRLAELSDEMDGMGKG